LNLDNENDMGFIRVEMSPLYYHKETTSILQTTIGTAPKR